MIIAEKNLTNKWLSEQLGVGQATISKWVQNNAQPNLEMLIKISKLLNVDINELIRREEVTLDQKAELCIIIFLTIIYNESYYIFQCGSKYEPNKR